MTTLISNKKARSEYDLEKKYTAGLVLAGQEVKSLRQKKGSLVGSYVKLVGSELFLLGAQINPYSYADTKDYDPKRTRKLLVSKRELGQITGLIEKKQRTLVPLCFMTQGRYIKLEFAVGRGLKQFEKREKIKRRDQERTIRRSIKAASMSF